MSGLVVYVNGAATGYESLASYTSAWNSLAAEGTIAPVPVAIELPVSAGNEYQDKTAKIRVLVEAVQGNANVDGAETVTYIAKATTAEDAMTALADPTVDYVCLAENMDLTIDSAVSNKTIDVNGSNANIKIAGDLSGVVITGIQDNDDAVPAVQFQAGATGDVTIADSYLYDHNSQPYGAVAGGTNAIDVTLVNCTLEGARPVYNAGNTKSLSILNCTIKNTSSWAVLINTSVVGDVVVDGCTFENCVGLLKVTGTVGGNFTFTNNEIVDCVTKNNFYIDVEVVGDITVSGNTMTTASNVVDDDVTEAEMLGIVKA